jgi:signal peptidase I
MPSPIEPSTSLTPPGQLQAATGSQRRAKSALREYAEALALAVLLALFIRSFVVQAFKIPSGSMLPTLQVGDHILVNKFIYGIRLPVIGRLLIPISSPQRGDVAVFEYPVDPSKEFIKRVAAVAGDIVEIRDKRVYINGKLWNDRHAFFADGSAHGHRSSPRDNYGPVTVPPGHIFVLGDNRDRSYDSRFWGFVDLAEVQGKAFLIYWSWDGEKQWVRWGRVGGLIK